MLDQLHLSALNFVETRLLIVVNNVMMEMLKIMMDVLIVWLMVDGLVVIRVQLVLQYVPKFAEMVLKILENNVMTVTPYLMMDVPSV